MSSETLNSPKMRARRLGSRKHGSSGSSGAQQLQSASLTHAATLPKLKLPLEKTMSMDSGRQVFDRHDVKRAVIRGSVKSPGERHLSPGSERSPVSSPATPRVTHSSLTAHPLAGYGELDVRRSPEVTTPERLKGLRRHEGTSRSLKVPRAATAAADADKRKTIEWDSHTQRPRTMTSSVDELKTAQGATALTQSKKTKSRTLPTPQKRKDSQSSSTSSLKTAFQFMRKQSEYADVIRRACAPCLTPACLGCAWERHTTDCSV